MRIMGGYVKVLKALSVVGVVNSSNASSDDDCQ